MENGFGELIDSLKKIHEESLRLQELTNLLDVIQKKQLILRQMKSIYGDIKLSEAIGILHEQYQNALMYKNKKI